MNPQEVWPILKRWTGTENEIRRCGDGIHHAYVYADSQGFGTAVIRSESDGVLEDVARSERLYAVGAARAWSEDYIRKHGLDILRGAS